MSKAKLITFIGAVIVVLIIAGLFIPKETTPSPDTRIILEHTYKTYIAPGLGCFERSDPIPTNYLQDSTLEEALKLDYQPHDSCTVKALESENDSLIFSLLKDIGILNKKWDNW